MAAFTFNYHPHPSTNHGPWRVPGSLPAQLSEFLGIRSDSSARGAWFGWDSGHQRCHGGASPEATTCANDEDDEGATVRCRTVYPLVN